MSFTQHFLTKAVPKVHDACGILYDKYDISCFAMDTTFADGKFSMLTDQKAFLEPYYYQDLTLSCVDRFGRALPTGVYTHRMMEHLDSGQYQKVQAYLSKLKTMQHILIAENHSGYQTLACFGFNMNDIEFDFLVANHTADLKQFLKKFQRHEVAMMAKQPEHHIFSAHVAQLELDRSRYQQFLSPASLAQQHCIDISGQSIILPPRQQDCLTHLLNGLSAKQIADKMELSVRTVDAYLAIIRKKTGCRNTFELLKRFM